jgi:hypothetical protein
VFGYVCLAALAYIPPLFASPGKVSAEPKNYLYLDPGRLLSRALYLWDPNIGLGTVTHQNIGFLFPIGPYYWAFDRLGVPDWIAQRLWLGSLLFFAAAGMLYLYRTLGQRGPGMVVGAVAYMLTPYALEFTSKFSDIILPWVALPWMVALVARALRKGGWGYPAAFAIVVQIVGGINATALLLAGLAPALWIPYAVWIAREVDWRRALGATLRIALLTLLASLWWIAGLWAQGRYGMDILRYTETVKAVSTTSTATETLRGLGYWYFYGGDRLALWTHVSTVYTQRLWILTTSFTVPVLALVSAAIVRWRDRVYFIGILLVGMVLAVGVYPYRDPSIVGRAFKSFAEGSTAGLALRSSSRATPLVVLGLAALLGVGVNAAIARFSRRERSLLALGASGAVIVVVVVSFAPIWNGEFYTPSLLRGDVPEYWTQAIDALDRQPHDTRILEIPGTDFANYVWGGTVEPITPGLTDRPYVARELVPWGSPPSADLLNALDNQMQKRVLDPESLPAVARLLAAGDVVLRDDLQVDRYDIVRPAELWALLHPRPEGLGAPTSYGPSTHRPHQDHLDERQLGLPSGASDGAPVVVYPVTSPKTIVHADATTGQLVVAGSGEGLVDAGARGLLDGDGAIVYSGSYARERAALRKLVDTDPNATLVVTDSNRRRAERWNGLTTIYGYTERAGEKPLTTNTGDSRLTIFPDAGDDARTVVEQQGATVEATGYGDANAYLPEDRAAKAFDGDVTTAWRTAGQRSAIGQRIQVDFPQPVTTDHVNLVQPLNGIVTRSITSATLRFDGGSPVTVALDAASHTAHGQTVTFPRRTFDHLSVTVDDTNVGDASAPPYDNPVGFAEIRVRDDRPGATDVRVDEVVRLPVDLVKGVGADSASRRLVYVLTRQRTRQTLKRVGEDEPTLVRELRVPTARSFDVRGSARLSPSAPDDVIDALLGLAPASAGGVTASSSARLAGSVQARASSALDGDATTAWTTPFGDPTGQWIDVSTSQPLTVDHLDLQLLTDGRHSVPTQLRIDAGGESRVVDVPATPKAVPGGSTTVPVSFPALTGTDFRVTVTGYRGVTTKDLDNGVHITAPIAVAELGIPGLAPVTFGTDVSGACRTDLLTVDGTPVPVRVVGDRETAVNLRALDVERCDPASATGVPLAAGDHELRSADGRSTGIDVDGITLASAAGGSALTLGPGGAVPTTSAKSTPKVRVVDNGRTSLHLRVTGATRPFWLVLGQSQNAGWKATADGHDLGGSQLVDGYANGWKVTPDRNGVVNVTLTWTPQRTVWVAIAISGVTLLVCLVLVLGLRRRRTRGGASERTGPEAVGVAAGEADQAAVVELPGRRDRALSRAATVAGTLGVGVGAAALSQWWVGVVVGAAFLLGARRPRLRWATALAAPAAFAVAAGYVIVQQARHHYPSVLEWPSFFDRVNALAWLAVLLLAADAVLEVLQRRPARRGK